MCFCVVVTVLLLKWERNVWQHDKIKLYDNVKLKFCRSEAVYAFLLQTLQSLEKPEFGQFL